MVRALPAGLLALWLTAELMSFVPALPAHPADAGLEAMLAATVAPGQLLFHAAGALIAGRATLRAGVAARRGASNAACGAATVAGRDSG